VGSVENSMIMENNQRRDSCCNDSKWNQAYRWEEWREKCTVAI